MHWFERIIIAIVIIVFAVTPAVYSLDIRVIWAVFLDLDVNIITAAMSTIIAVCVLVVTVRQKRQNLEYNQLSVRPLLGSSLLNSRKGRSINIKFELVNYGIGPAIIETVILYFNGDEELRNSSKKYVEFINKNIKGFDKKNLGFVVPDSIIAIGERQIIWDITYNDRIDIFDFIKKLDMRVEYKSIYGVKMCPYDTRYDIKFHDDNESP